MLTSRQTKSTQAGAIIVILNLLVVSRLPMNEDADADEEVVGLLPRNHAFCHAVGNCAASCSAQQLRQLGDVGRNAPGLVGGLQLRCQR